MIRIVCKEVFLCPEGSVTATGFKTFDIEHPELEKLLTAQRSYHDVSVVGAEIVPPSTSARESK